MVNSLFSFSFPHNKSAVGPRRGGPPPGFKGVANGQKTGWGEVRATLPTMNGPFCLGLLGGGLSVRLCYNS
ncbi:MAG: hypothetical protein AUK31_03000 [Fibrobacteres bacterium CG2_30_45_31]|nr:MAG: hypothetical protein AUK31_03000 [Fibrobacteres bacterium CG2_30_45_31]